MRNQANDTILQLTLREMHSQITNIRFIAGFLAVVVILIAAGPFGTFEHYSLLERTGYWLIVAPVSFLIADFFATSLTIWLIRLGWGRWLSFIGAGILSGIPVGLFLWGFDWLIDPNDGGNLWYVAPFILNATFVTVPVTLIYALKYEAPSSNTDARQYYPFFDKLPKKLGKDLIYLKAQDHYIEVATSTGKELVLMRLSDAIGQLRGFDGFQTHRSWWVADQHIKKIVKNDGKKVLILSDGTSVPVSRSYAKNISEMSDL